MSAVPDWLSKTREHFEATDKSQAAMTKAVEAAFPGKSKWMYRGFRVTINVGGFDPVARILWATIEGPTGEFPIAVKVAPGELKPITE